jgi:hypothetical protein
LTVSCNARQARVGIEALRKDSLQLSMQSCDSITTQDSLQLGGFYREKYFQDSCTSGRSGILRDDHPDRKRSATGAHETSSAS